MTTEEILLTVLTVAIVVLIAMVLAVLFMILRVVKKVNTTINGAQHIATTSAEMFKSVTPIRILMALMRSKNVSKRR